MAISFVNKGTFTSGTTALSVPMPASIQAGDILLLIVNTANQPVPTPSGWTQVGTTQSFGTAAAIGASALQVYWKTASASESSVTVGSGTANYRTAIIVAYRGASGVYGAAGGGSSTAITSHSLPSVTTTSDGDFVILTMGLDIDGASTARVTSITNANLTSLTERHDQTIATGVGGGLFIGDGIDAAAGISGTTTATTTSTAANYLSFALATTLSATATNTLANFTQSSSGTVSSGGGGGTTTLTLTRPGDGTTPDSGSLSTDSLTWTSGSGYNRTWSTTKKTLGTGKWLVEFQFVTDAGDSDLQVGFATGTSADNNAGWLGQNATEIGIFKGDGFIYQSSSNDGREMLSGGFAAGDYIQFAIDLTDNTNGPKVWTRRKRSGTVTAWNIGFNVGGGTGDPAAGTSPATGFSASMTDYYLCLQGSTSGDVFTANFTGTSSQFPSVTGFDYWDTGSAPATISGSASNTLDAFTQSASSTLVSSNISGSATNTLANFTQSASGTVSGGTGGGGTVTFVNAAAFTSDFGGGSGSITVTPPTGLSSGDMWLIWAADDNNGSDGIIAVPSGWTDITGDRRAGAGFPAARAFYKIAGASEASVSVSFGSGSYGSHAHSLRISGVNTTTPIGNKSYGTTVAAPSVVIQNNGSLAILYCHYFQGSSSTVPTAPAGTTTASTSAGGGYCHTGVAYKAVDAGTFSAGNWTVADTTDLLTASIEIIPGATGASGSTGSASNTLDAVTQSASAQNIAKSGTVTNTIAAVTQSAVSKNIAKTGSVTNTLDAFSQTSSANNIIKTGSVTSSLAAVTSDASGLAATDPYYSATVLNVTFDGVDAATTAVDTRGHTLTFNGSAQIDTAQSKFGGSSLLIGGVAGSYVSTPDSADWHFDSGAFTVEAWVYQTSGTTTGYQTIVGQWDTANNDRAWWLNIQTTWNAPIFDYSTTGTDFTTVPTNTNSTQTVTLNAWHHIAVDRDGAGTLRVYMDGVMLAKATSVPAFHDSAATLNIGRDTNTGRELKGWIDDVRITKGVARYASDSGYSVPTAPYPQIQAVLPTVSGSATNTIDAFTQSATAKNIIKTGVVSNSIAAVTQATASKAIAKATATNTIEAVTQSATTGVPVVNATALNAIGEVTQSASLVAIAKASASNQIASVTQAASANNVIKSGTVSNSIAAVTQSSAVVVKITASVTNQIGELTQFASSQGISIGQASNSLDAVTQTAAAKAIAKSALLSNIPAVTQTTNVDLLAKATLTSSIPAITQSAASKGFGTSQAANQLDQITQNASGVVKIVGEGISTIANFTQNASTGVPIVYTSPDMVLAPFTQTASSKGIISATSTSTLDNFSIVTNVDLVAKASASQSFAVPTQVGNSKSIISLSALPIIQNFNSLSSGKVIVKGSATQVLDPITGIASTANEVHISGTQSLSAFIQTAAANNIVSAVSSSSVSSLSQSAASVGIVTARINADIADVGMVASAKAIITGSSDITIGSFDNNATAGRLILASANMMIDQLDMTAMIRKRKATSGAAHLLF